MTYSGLQQDRRSRSPFSAARTPAISYGFEDLGLNRIEARCRPDNIASARVMEKCGMSYEGTLREHVFDKGRFEMLLMYAVLRGDWRGIRSERGTPEAGRMGV